MDQPLMIAQLDKDILNIRPASVLRRLMSYALFEGRPLTTRGRWINSLLFAQFRAAQHLPALKQVEKPVYILGTGRSGTTFLGKLFHMHRLCGFLNEPKAMWHAIFPEEDVIGSYTRGPAYYRLNENQVTDAVRRRACRLFGYYLLLSGARRTVDKYPELIFRIPFIRAIFPDAKFVFLVRNGLDALRSIAAWSGTHGMQAGSETHDWWGADNRKWQLLVDQVVADNQQLSPFLDRIRTFDRQEEMAAVEWIVTMQEGLHWMKRLPDQVYQVRYEELTGNPDKTLKALLDFCELPRDAAMFQYARTAVSPPPPKAPVVLSPDIESPFYQTMALMGYPSGPERMDAHG